MKKLFMCFGMAVLLFATANAQDSILLRTEKVWYNDSFEDTGVYGVNTEKAWQFLKEHNRKANPLVVGILDGGVQTDHIDLAENMWVNPKEKPGNGKDDDKNGF
ncbi:MAG: peptidase S8, partial [Moheibacter sp.]